jgi:hypothetical protein
MRMLNPSLAAVSLLGFLTAASCTLITDVDRTKIPTDAGAPTGGMGATGGTSGDSGMAGVGNEGGSEQGGTGGTGQGGGGTGGSSAGTGGTSAGTGGTGTPTEVCDKATGRITVGEGTLIAATGDTFSVSDGINAPVTFEFRLTGEGDSPDNQTISFTGTPTEAELAIKIANAINDASDLDVTATTSAVLPSGGGEGGAGGESGAAGNAGATGAGIGGEGGAATTPPAHSTETVNIVNNRAGARGNQKLTDTIGNPNFKVSGMSGGNAVVCGEAALCNDDSECASDSCISHVCDLP